MNISENYESFLLYCYTLCLIIKCSEEEIINFIHEHNWELIFLNGVKNILDGHNFMVLDNRLLDKVQSISNALRFDKYENSNVKKLVYEEVNGVIFSVNVLKNLGYIERDNRIRKFLYERNVICGYSINQLQDKSDIINCMGNYHDRCLAIYSYEDASCYKDDFPYLEVINMLLSILDFDNEFELSLFNYMHDSIKNLMKYKNEANNKFYRNYVVATYKNIMRKAKSLDSDGYKVKGYSI